MKESTIKTLINIAFILVAIVALRYFFYHSLAVSLTIFVVVVMSTIYRDDIRPDDDKPVWSFVFLLICVGLAGYFLQEYFLTIVLTAIVTLYVIVYFTDYNDKYRK
jgi:O-antigen/teichoic acid export membrane protein